MASEDEYQQQQFWEDKWVNHFWWPMRFKDSYKITGQNSGNMVLDHIDDKGRKWYRYEENETSNNVKTT